MRLSRPVTAALRPRTIVPAAVMSAAVCLGAAACGTTGPAAGAAYGTSSATPGGMTSTSSSPSAQAASGNTLLTVRKTAAGYVLATHTGQTIYWYSTDVKGSGKSTCTGSCLTVWPAVTGTPAAAAGVQLAGKLGTITRPGGVVQATYNGYPLYTYAQDMSPGQVTGNGSGGVWHIITGAVLSSSPASAAAASLRDTGGAAPASSPTGSTSGYGGY